jgi:ubiquinone/menaquinone biosynthesis C-methylase UbiE
MSEKSRRKNESRERFNRFAPRYVTSATHAKAPELQRLVEIARPQPSWTMLDIATGGGHTALAFTCIVQSVIAADVSSGMLSAAWKFIRSKGALKVLFAFADAARLPFLASSFDLITCRIAAHHFRDVNQFVADCARVLKPGRWLLVQDQCLPENTAAARYIDRFERLRDPSHRR